MPKVWLRSRQKRENFHRRKLDKTFAVRLNPRLLSKLFFSFAATQQRPASAVICPGQTKAWLSENEEKMILRYHKKNLN